MNKILCFLVAIIFISCSSQKVDGIEIIGQVENAPNGAMVVLEKVTETGNKPIDSTQITNGKYSLVLSDPEASFYTLNFNNRQKIALVIQGNEESLEVNADGDDPRGFFEISGSQASEYKSQMDEVMKAFQQDVKVLQGRQFEARQNNDLNAFQSINQEIQQLAQNGEKKLKQLIRKSVPTLAAYYGIQMIQFDNNITFVDSIAQQLSAQLPNNFMVEELSSKVSASRSLAVGAKAPEIILPDPDGELISLSSLKGKYVLVDFWAAWCGPCRRENPNVVRVYNEYSDRNFEILGVSLDRTKNAWLKAIEQDGLPWLHISDLKYWKSEAARAYQITAIPATYLIGPDGTIIAKNLRGSSLEAKLKEIFG